MDHSDGNGPIAVHDPSPTFRRGLAGLLREAGLHPVEPDDLHTWTDSPSHRSAVVTVDGAAGLAAIDVLVRRRPDLVLIAMLPTLDLPMAAAALRAGAASIVHRDEVTDRVLTVIRHALSGDALLPVDLARLLAHAPALEHDHRDALTPDEVSWLSGLARNRSVAKVAADAGLSERTMYRRLDQLFHRIGAHNRIEAITWATRHHYLDAPP